MTIILLYLIKIFILCFITIKSNIIAEQINIYKNFNPHDESHTCTHDTHAIPFNTQVRGANIGGWLVLEPWITPSLFYQFLGAQRKYGDKAPEKTGLDLHSFCTALGDEEANRQLRIHWKKFLLEEDIKKMASFGVNSIRIPVGDWMFVPYEPYIGCTNGSIEELNRALDLAYKYNMSVLLDIHGHRGSQNGFDNSGHSKNLQWTSIASTVPIGTTTFEHWPIRVAEWVGKFNATERNYTAINYENIALSLKAVEIITKIYKDHPAILGLEPINEPWEMTPLNILKDFYWEGYKIVKRIAPTWKYVMHDSFRFGLGVWKGFMKGCPDVALDTHIYQAWMNPGSKEDFFSNACQQKYLISTMEKEVMPVIVGEWSLATDNCAMWLNGFNDNLPGFPKVQCRMIKCPKSYLGKDIPEELDRTRPIQGPYGTGVSGPSFGKCPVTSDNFFTNISDKEMYTRLGYKKINSFTVVGHGYYFWNFKTEIDIKWDFIRSIESGYIPKNVTNPGKAAEMACRREDKGEFICAAKRGVSDNDIKKGLAYACNQDVNCTGFETLYPNLLDRADYVFNKYWHEKRIIGATCDFGGAASLEIPPDAKLPPLPFFDPNATLATTQLYNKESLHNAIKATSKNNNEIIFRKPSNLFNVKTIVGSTCTLFGLISLFVIYKKIYKRKGYTRLHSRF